MNHLMLFETFGGYEYTHFEEYGRYVYQFTCKDGTTIYTQFTDDPDKEGVFYREYGTGNLDALDFDEINTNDGVRILRTVTRITIEFMQKYQPYQVIIFHVPTAEEAQAKRAAVRFGQAASTQPNKRARINRLFLEPELPKNYAYSLVGSSAKITKIS